MRVRSIALLVAMVATGGPLAVSAHTPGEGGRLNTIGPAPDFASVIDASGTLRVQYLGVRFDPDELFRDLRSLLGERTSR